jgi:hypothetical protein
LSQGVHDNAAARYRFRGEFMKTIPGRGTHHGKNKNKPVVSLSANP